MLRPTLTDDGLSVTLDLHGARVSDAESMALRAVELAALAGRGSIRLVHGHSTTGAYNERRTIKSALLDLLESGAFDGQITSELLSEGQMLFGLRVTSRRDKHRITLSDLNS